MAYGPPPLYNCVVFEQQQQIATVMGRQRTKSGGWMARRDMRRHRLRYVYDFHSYSNIVNAAAEIESTLPDLIVCKQDMTPMTGSELCNRVKTKSTLSKIKFVLMIDGKLTGE